jgi:hypothetical protein
MQERPMTKKRFLNRDGNTTYHSTSHAYKAQIIRDLLVLVQLQMCHYIIYNVNKTTLHIYFTV